MASDRLGEKIVFNLSKELNTNARIPSGLTTALNLKANFTHISRDKNSLIWWLKVRVCLLCSFDFRNFAETSKINQVLMNDWKAATTKETFQHICGLQLFWRLAGKQCLTAASDHVPWGQMFPLSRVNAVRITGHKGKHGAVRVCPRGFPHEPLNEPHTVSPLAPYISLPCWGWVALPIPPLMFRKTRSTICDRRWNRPERAGPQLTVIYKIVLVLASFFFFFFFFLRLSLFTCTLADVVEVAQVTA